MRNWHGNLSPFGKWHGPRKRVAFDPDALAYIQAVEAADGEPLEAGVRVAYDQFVRGCKQDGIWEAIKASCIMAGARTLSGALVPLVGPAPTNFNFVSGDYDRVTGLKGDGSTKYLDSNRNNNADPQNNQHLAAWKTGNHITVTNQGGTGAFGAYLGAGGALTGASSIVRAGGSTGGLNEGMRLQHSAFVGGLGPEPPALGFVGASRFTSASYSFRTDGTSQLINETSEAPTSDSILVLARGDGLGEAQGFSLARLSFYSIGEALDLEALDNRTTALMNAIEDALITVQATGGIETVINPAPGKFFRVHTFLESGDLTVTQGGQVEYLVVAGGGGGGSRAFGSGGGGAGGLLNDAAIINPDTYGITVGVGGRGGSSGGPNDGDNGENSSFDALAVAIGGGGGGRSSGADLFEGKSGGSGGGGGSGVSSASPSGGDGVFGQGFAGGAGLGLSDAVNNLDQRGGGGGGGSSSNGGDATGTSISDLKGGDGGDGVSLDISGAVVVYAGGGAGSAENQNGSAGLGGSAVNSPGIPNTGAGGGSSTGNQTGGNGGSGIVIIRYRISESEYNAEAA